jgi:hypothetical protein
MSTSWKARISQIVGAKASGLYRLRRSTALDSWGWYESCQNGFPCEKDGTPIPWMSYSAIALLKSRVRQSWNVFEFGTGYSTIWWGNHCQSVMSCEHDIGWCRKIGKSLPGNCSLIPIPLDQNYPLAAQKTQRLYDVIVVDGRKRVKCAISSINCLNPTGIIIWDDSDRPYYREGLDFFARQNFKRLDLIGMSPTAIDPKQTSILYRPGNVLDL